MTKTSAGILMWRRRKGELELLLGHFGGPMWRNRDDGAWAIPKGLMEPGESAEETARREFEEEIGHRPEGALTYLGRIRQKGGKWVEAFAVQGEVDPKTIASNLFTLEWPPRSGRFESFPEIDRVEWFTLDSARKKILNSQLPLIELIEQSLN